MALKCYTSMEKGLKLIVRKFLRITPTFVEITEEKLLEERLFAPLTHPPPPILNSVKKETLQHCSKRIFFYQNSISIFFEMQ